MITELYYVPQDSNIYLIGTWDGLIHKCSCSNTQHVLETYKSHLVSVSSQPHLDIVIFSDYIQSLVCV